MVFGKSWVKARRGFELRKICLPIIALLVLGLSGCTALGIGTHAQFDVCSAASAVKAQQSAFEIGAQTLISLHRTKAVPDATYAKAQQIYSVWSQTQQLIALTIIAFNDGGLTTPQPQMMQQYSQLLVQAVGIAAEFAAMYYSAAPAGRTPPMAVAAYRRSAAYGAMAENDASCSMTDDQIRATLAVPSWSAMGG